MSASGASGAKPAGAGGAPTGAGSVTGCLSSTPAAADIARRVVAVNRDGN